MRFALLALVSGIAFLYQVAAASAQVNPSSRAEPVQIVSSVPLSVSWTSPQPVHLPQTSIEDAFSHQHNKPIMCSGCPDLPGFTGSLSLYIESEDPVSVRLRYQNSTGDKVGQLEIPVSDIRYVVIKMDPGGSSTLYLYLR